MFTTAIHRRLLPALLATAVMPLAVPAAAQAAPPRHAPPVRIHARRQPAVLPAPRRRSGRGDVAAPPAGAL
jgi:hypothetical protein